MLASMLVVGCLCLMTSLVCKLVYWRLKAMQCTDIVNYFLLFPCVLIFVDYYIRIGKLVLRFLLFCVMFRYAPISVNLKFLATISTYQFVLVL